MQTFEEWVRAKQGGKQQQQQQQAGGDAGGWNKVSLLKLLTGRL